MGVYKSSPHKISTGVGLSYVIYRNILRYILVRKIVAHQTKFRRIVSFATESEKVRYLSVFKAGGG